MNSSSRLTQQLDAYYDWKERVRLSIENYRDWLQSHDMRTDQVDVHLDRAKNTLFDDRVNIAAVGEYSRGKTELINALVFGHYGQRILPSAAGRTTMCPSEIFYDVKAGRSYLKLLPIETRAKDASIKELKNIDELWHEEALDTTDADDLANQLKRLVETKTVTLAAAQALGFSKQALESDLTEDGMVVIPAWRHALISIDHVMLRMGLCILDTPGLNALGSEPELTVSAIPNAHAVAFILGADTGVTASDFDIWNTAIRRDGHEHPAGRFAILNKVDMLRDELNGEEHYQNSVESMCQGTAKKLGIDRDKVVPVSAKQALIGRIKNQDELIQQSGIQEFEDILYNDVLSQKLDALDEQIIDDLRHLIASSNATMHSRLSDLKEEYEEQRRAESQKDELLEIGKSTRGKHDQHQRQLLMLKSNRRLLQAQAEVMMKIVSAENFEKVVADAKYQMEHSWSTFGTSRAMMQCFTDFEFVFNSLVREMRQAEKMVLNMFDRFKQHEGVEHLWPKSCSFKRQQSAFEALQKSAKKFTRSPKFLMTEQTVLINRFLRSFVTELQRIHKELVGMVKIWPDQAILPLMQHVLEQKQSLEVQVAELKELAGRSKNSRERQEELMAMMNRVQNGITEINTIENQLVSSPKLDTPRQNVG